MLEKNHLKKNKPVQNQQGFTLIEIIAVLIILGLLAAVAVPKFGSLTEEARKKALDEAFAAGRSQVNMAYSEYLLKTGGVNPTSINDINDHDEITIPTDLGDFDAAYSDADDDHYTVEVEDNEDTTPDWFSEIDSEYTSKDFRYPWATD